MHLNTLLPLQHVPSCSALSCRNIARHLPRETFFRGPSLATSGLPFRPSIKALLCHASHGSVLKTVLWPLVQVEVLAKQVLQSPIEIQVGGRSVVNADISQFVEIRPEEDRFLRLLEILGEWYEKGKILIFVSSQDQCDNLFRDLIKVGLSRLVTVNSPLQCLCELYIALPGCMTISEQTCLSMFVFCRTAFMA